MTAARSSTQQTGSHAAVAATSAISSGSRATRLAGPLAPRTLPQLPSAAALALEQSSLGALERVLQRGITPNLDALIGWEFRGINVMPPGGGAIAKLAGIKKFVKGMFRDDAGRIMGYNCPVVQNALDGRWTTKPSNAAPKRFGFYELAAVDPTSRDNHYLHAVLLDYGKGGNRAWDPSATLRDYLVQIDADNPDLLLGKAYAAVGPLRVPMSFFILERFRRGI